MLVDVGAAVLDVDNLEEEMLVVVEVASEVDSAGLSVDEAGVSKTELRDSEVKPSEVATLVLVRRVVGGELRVLETDVSEERNVLKLSVLISEASGREVVLVPAASVDVVGTYVVLSSESSTEVVVCATDSTLGVLEGRADTVMTVVTGLTAGQP